MKLVRTLGGSFISGAKTWKRWGEREQVLKNWQAKERKVICLQSMSLYLLITRAPLHYSVRSCCIVLKQSNWRHWRILLNQINKKKINSLSKPVLNFRPLGIATHRPVQFGIPTNRTTNKALKLRIEWRQDLLPIDFLTSHRSATWLKDLHKWKLEKTSIGWLWCIYCQEDICDYIFI